MNAATLLLAAATSSPTPQRTSEGMKSGPWGLAMILLLCIAVYFLWRSMNGHLRKVRERTDAAGRWSASAGRPPAPAPVDAGASAAGWKEPHPDAPQPDASRSGALPSNALPSNALPSNALPSNALPSNALPSNAARPDVAAPDFERSDAARPDQAN